MPPETIGLDSLFAEMERELAAKQVPESIGKLARSMGLQPTSVGKPTGTGQQQPSARSEQRPVQVPRISQRQPPQQPQRDPNRLIGTDFGAENLAKRYAERRPVLAQEGPQYEESAFGEARKIWEGALSAAEQESRDIRSRLVLDPMAYPEEQKRQDYARLHGAGEREPAVPGTVNWRAGRAKARLKDVDFAQKLESVNPKVANDFFERSKAFYDLDDRLQVEKRALGSEKQRLDQQRSGMEQRKAEIARLQAEATDALRMPNALEQAFGGVFGQQRDPAQSASIQRDIATHTMKLAAEQKAYNASYNQYLRRSAAARSAEKQRYNLQANYVSARDSARAELEAQQRQQLQAPAPDPQVVGAARAIDPGIYDVTMRRAGHKIKPLSLEGMGKFGRAMFAPVLDTNLDKYQREFLGDERFPSVVRMDIGPDGKQTKHGVVPAMNLTQAQQASRLVEEFLTPHRQRWDATMMAQRRQPIAAMAHGAADVGAEAAAALAQEMALWDTQETATANDEYLRSHSLPGALEYAKQRLGREPTQLEKQVIASQLAWDGYRFAKHPDVQKSILMDAGLAILGEGVGSLVAKPLVGLVGRTAAKLGMKRAVPKVAEAAGGSVLRRPLEVVRSPAQKAVATAAEAVGGVSARVAPNLTAAAGKVAAGANRVIPEVFEPTDMFQNSVASAIQQSGAYLATEENPKADRALLEGLAGLAFGAAATPAFKGVMRGIGAAAKGGWGLTKAGRQWIADNYRNWKDPRDVQAALDQIQSGAVPGQPANPTYAPALRITARFPAKPDARVQAEAPGTTPSTVTTPGASPVVEPELDLPRIVDEEDFAAPSDVVMPRVPPVPPVSQPRPATPTAAPATGQVSTASPTPTSAKPDVPVVEQPASKPSQSETLADIFRAATTAKQAETTGKRRGEAGAGIVKIKDLLPAIVERVPELKRRRGEKPEAYQGRVGQAVKDMLHDHPGEFHSFADSLDPKEQFFGTDSGGIRRTLGWIESKTKPEPQPATVQAGPTAPSVPPVRRPASAPKPKAEPTPEERSLVNSLADRQDQLLDSGDSKAALELLDKELEVRRRYPDYQPEELASVLKWRQSLENRVQREAAEADAAIHRSQPKPAPTSPVVDSQAVRTANFTRGRFPDDPSWAGAFDSSDPAAFDARIQKSPSFEKYAEGSSDREALSALREQWGTLRKSSSAPIEATSPKKATVPAAKASEPAPAPRPETPGQIAYREELERRIAKAEADERMEARVRGQANLPPELSSARPAYKSNPVQFERDYDKAAYTVAGRGESKSHAKYVDWLEDNGYDLQEAKRRGQEIRDDLKGRPVPGVDEDGKAKPYIVESSSRPQNPPAAKGASIPPVTARPRAPRVKAEPVVEARPGPATDTTARAADATAPAAKPDVATPKSAEPRTAKTLSDLAEDFGKKNVTVTKEDLDKNLAVLREMKLLSGAPPPEALQALAKIAVYYVEGGVRAYPDFHRIMLEAVGSKLEPFFRRAYNKARALLDDYPWVAKEMTPDDEIDAFHKAREASPARPSVPKVAIAPDKPVAPKPEPVAPKPRPDWEQKADQKATARNSLLASLTKAINSGDAVEANKIADRIGNLYSDEIELRLDNGQKAQADALAAANDKFYKTIQQWNSRQAKPEVPNAKSPAPNGRKPSLAAIEDGLIASGLLRQEERDAKTSVMPAALLRAIPQGRWVTMKDAVRETVLFRIAADGMIRTGLIERRYDQAGDAFYAWSGTKPLAGMITDEQARTKWPIAEDADPGSEKPRPSVPKIEPEPEKPRRPLTRAEKADAHVATRVEADAEWLRAEGDPRKQAGIATKALQAIDDELAIRDATDPKARVAQAAKRRWADRAKTVKAAVPETLDGSLGPLRYKPETDSYNGLKLKNGDILSDADGGLWAVDRVRGFLLNLERLDDAGSGYKYPRESVTRSVDPTDRVRFSDLEFTGRNLYPEKPAAKAPTRDIEDVEFIEDTYSSIHKSNADTILAVEHKDKFHTLWIRRKLKLSNGKSEWSKWTYISNLPSDPAEARESILSIARDIASGKGRGFSFSGGQATDLVAKVIGIATDGVSRETLHGSDAISIGESMPFKKHPGVTVNRILDVDQGYALLWAVNRDDPVARYLRRQPEVIDVLRKSSEKAEATISDPGINKAFADKGMVLSLGDSGVYVSGNTREFSAVLKESAVDTGTKAKWDPVDKRWLLDAEAVVAASKRLSEVEKPSDDTKGGLAGWRTNPTLVRKREAAAAMPDASPIKDTGKYVGDDTAALIRRGKDYGMPEDIVAEQVEDVAMITRAWDQDKGAFLLASDPGAGKTFVLGGAIRELRKRGAKKIVYVTLRDALIDQIKKDLADYGIHDVEFTTYTKLRSADPEMTDVLIFDEGHSVKNVMPVRRPAPRLDGARIPDQKFFSAPSQQAQRGKQWIDNSRFVVFASATPFENISQFAYLAGTKLFDDVYGGYWDFARAHGAVTTVYRSTGRRDAGTVYEELIQPKRYAGTQADLIAARDFLKKQGVFTSRPIRLPEGAADARMGRVKITDEWANNYKAFDEAIKDVDTPEFAGQEEGTGRSRLGSDAKMWLVNFKKRLLEASKVEAGIAEAKAALKAGRNPIIFVETKSERIHDIPYLIEEENAYQAAVQMALEARMSGFSDMEMPKRRDFYTLVERDGKPRTDGGGLPPAGVAEIFAKYMEDTGQERLEIPAVEDKIVSAFGDDVAVYTGSVTDAAAKRNLEAWRSGKKRVLVATMAKGGTGLSLHDKIGDHPTTQIMIGLPWTATQVKQVAQRSARYGLKGNAQIIWLFTDQIPFDAGLAQRVGRRMGDMGASLHGTVPKDAISLEGWEFNDELFSTTDNVAEAEARHPLEPEWAGEELDNLEGRLEGFIPGHTVEWKVGGKVATGVVTGLTSKRLKVRLPGDQTVYVPAGMATRVRPVGKPLSSAVDGKTTNVKVKTPEGDSRRYRVRYAVVDLDDLIVSHDPHTFDPNLEYDEQFQPRGRDADGTRAQVVTIEKKFDPEEVGQNLMADLGAPIVDRRTSFVISGNGRTMAINRVAKNDPAKWGEYTDWLKESAPDFGVSAKALDGINRPVLVRVLDEDLSPEELLEFVQLTNDDLLASKPIRELAVQDAGKITNDLLQAFDVGESGDITAASNKAFVQGFLHSLSANERNGLVAANGVLNVDGKNRLQAALFYKAYKDKDALARMADAVDADAKNVTNAMVQAAPALIQHNEGIRAGYLQSLGISQDVAAAANRFYDLRRNNMAVSTFLDTKQLLGEELDGFQRTLLKFLDDNKRSAVRIKETIAAYVDLATREGDPRDRSMFGDDVPKKPVKSREELWDLAAKRVEEDRAKAPQKPKQAVQGQPSSPTTLMQWSSPAKQMAITDLGQETIEEAVGNQVASLRGMATLPGIIGKLRDRHSVREITDAVNRMESSGSIFRDGSIYRRGPKPASSDGGDLKMKAAAESQMTLFQKQSGEAKAGDSVGKPTEPMATEPTPPELHGLGEYEARMADMLERRFGHTAEQAKAVATEVAAIADAWAKDTGRTPQEWYDRNIKSFARGTGGPSDAKGMIQFLPDGRAILVALNNPDVTTSIHEVGHILRRSLYDRLDEATDEARPSIEADIAALEAWVGAGEVKGKAWSEAAEEKFARGWERYHATGKAPTPKLQGIFDRMKAWFLGIYKAIKGSDIDVDLPPEVVAAYDRLLTGERKAHSATVRPVPEVRTRTGAPKPSRPVSPDKPATAATGVFGTGKPALRTDGSSVLESGTPDEIFTGLANAMNEAAVERGVISELPPKGDVRSIRDSYDAGVAEYAAKGGLSHAEQLAEEVADGRRAFSWDTVGVLTQGLRDLENAVNAAMDKMVRAKHRGLDIGLKTAAGEFQAAQERLARYLANVQIGKTEWHNTGMALQQMVSLEYGNFARLERRARQMKGGDLLPSERANLQDMAKRYQELEAAYNEQLSKTEQVLAAQRATVSRQRAEEARAALARSARDPKSLMKNAGEIGQKARQSAAEVLASLKRKFSNLADGVNNLQQRSGARVPKVQQPTVLKQSMPPKKTLVPYDPDVQPGVAREIAKLVIQMDPKRNLYQMADEVVRMFADDANIEITPEQVIEEFGATASQSEMAEVARRIMALKGEARRHQQYIDKLQGRQAPPKPKSPHTDAPSTEALKAQVKAQEDAARAKKKADADLARTQAKIADVQAKIAAMTAQVQAGRGSVAPSVPRPSNAPPALKALRDELAALKIEARKQQRLRDIIATGQVPTSQPRATRPDSPATEALKAQAEPIFKADRKARAEARKQDVALQNRLRAERTQRAKDKVQAEINMLNKALQDGVLPAEWNAKKGPSKNVDHELEMLRYKRHLLKTEVNATLEELTPRDIMDTLLAFSQFPKVLTASWDISAAGRQGWRLGLAHPGIARQAFKRQIEALNSGDAAARIQYELLNRKNAPYYKKMGIDVTSKEEMFAYMPILKHWKKGNPYLASDRAYSTYLNQLRTGVADKILGDHPERFSEADLKLLGDYINQASGRGGGTDYAAAAKFLSLIFYAPRFMASHVTYLTVTPLRLLNGKYTPEMRKAILKSYIQTAAAYSALVGLAKLGEAMGGGAITVENDPRSADWGKVKFGDTRVDITGGTAGYLSLATRISKHSKVSSTTGKETELDTGEFGGTTSWDELGRFLRNKLAPLPSVGVSTHIGLDFRGRQYGWAEAIKDVTAPMSAREVLEAVADSGVDGEDALQLLNIIGLSTTRYVPERIDWTAKHKVGLPRADRDVVEKELFRLKDHVGPPPFAVKHDDEELRLTKAEREESRAKMAPMIYQALRQMFDDKYYKASDDKSKEKMIRAEASKVRAAAMGEIRQRKIEEYEREQAAAR